MALYRIPWPWDYHCQGAIIVTAKSAVEAQRKAREYVRKEYGEDRWQDPAKILWKEMKRLDNGVTEDGGCDC